MTRLRHDDPALATVREAMRRRDDAVGDEPDLDDDANAAGDPERPDAPLGVPEDADPDERPGFPREDPSHG